MTFRAILCLSVLAACEKETPSLYNGPRSALDDSAALAARQACMFKAGDPAGVSVPKNAPLGREIPVDTIVVLMMENRSFDHLLSNLPAFGQPDVDVATTADTNPDSSGAPVAFHHLDPYCFADTNHEWTGCHDQFHDGAMDGFVTTNENWSGGGPSGARAMGYYDERELPFLYAAANKFAISDSYFCSVLGPTFTNREFLYAGTSFGYTSNQILFEPKPNILEEMEAKKLDWRIYSETLPGPAIFLDVYSKYIGDHFSRLEYFEDDAAQGKLAPLVFVDPNLRDDGAARDDLHPPGDVQLGDQFMARVANALMKSPQWKRSALIITFDEHGGLYDHVPPPSACAPDDSPLMVGGDPAYDGFQRLGFRVPLVVISPWAKPHFVSHRVYDHTSILRFIEARYELAALTKRDANADPLYDLFDFSKASFAEAQSLPASTVDQARLDDCIAQFPMEDGGIPGLPTDM